MQEGLTALMIATNRGKVKVVDALLKSKNIDIDKSDEVCSFWIIYFWSVQLF